MRENLTLFLEWLIKKLNRSKDRSLAMRLHLLAETYEPDPGWWSRNEEIVMNKETYDAYKAGGISAEECVQHLRKRSK